MAAASAVTDGARRIGRCRARESDLRGGRRTTPAAWKRGAARRQSGQAGKDMVETIERFGTERGLKIYLVHLITRNSFGLMTRKLSVTESQRLAQFRGTVSRRKPSVALANWAQVA